MANQTNNSTSDFISEVNSHVEESLNDYCSLSKPLQFAILLKGSWGCGKSWFINQYIEKLKKQDDTKTPLYMSLLKKRDSKKTPLYVSLYGVNNFSQIDEALFEQTHPQLSSKNAKIARKAVKSWLSTYRIHSELSLKDFLNTSIQDDSKYNLLVFDDLERCSIDIEDIFGYINNFVGSEYLTVVIVADEDKIYAKYENDGKYKKIKEKLILKTLEIFPDFQAAFKSFIEKLKTEQARDFLLNNINLIKALFDEGECKNIRILNQVILDFERVFKALTEKAQNKSELTEKILKILIIFSIEIAIGRLETKDIQKSINKVLSQYKNTLTFDFDGLFPSLSWWSDFFNKGTVNKDVLEKEIVNSKYFQDENTPNWLKLRHYTRHSDEEFSEILNQVDSEYKDRKFEDIGIIKHITGLFLMFSDVNLYSKSKSDIVKEAKKYIDDLKSSGKLDLTYRDMERDSQAKDYQEFKDFNNYIKQCQEKEIEKNMPNEAQELLRIMQKNVFIFHYCITYSSNLDILEKRYPDYPIFKYLLPEDFMKTILTLPNKIIPDIFHSLQERYNLNGITEKKLVDELDFLKGVQKLLLEEVDARKGKLSGFLLKRSNEILEKVISNLE